MRYKVMVFLITLLICRVSFCQETYKSNDEALKVVRSKIFIDDYERIEIQVFSERELGGYLVVNEIYSDSVSIVADTTSEYSPYIILGNKIRFVLNDSDLERQKAFRFSYLLKVKKGDVNSGKGAVRYLIENRPVPEIKYDW